MQESDHLLFNRRILRIIMINLNFISCAICNRILVCFVVSVCQILKCRSNISITIVNRLAGLVHIFTFYNHTRRKCTVRRLRKNCIIFWIKTEPFFLLIVFTRICFFKNRRNDADTISAFIIPYLIFFTCKDVLVNLECFFQIRTLCI